MKISMHFLISFVFMAALYPFFKEAVLYIFVGGVLVDIDHYFWYVLKLKTITFSFKKVMKYYDDKDFKDILNIFHTVEFVIAFFLFCLYFKLYLLYLGYVVHLLMDFVYLYRHKILSIRAVSFIMWSLRRI